MHEQMIVQLNYLNSYCMRDGLNYKGNFQLRLNGAADQESVMNSYAERSSGISKKQY